MPALSGMAGRLARIEAWTAAPARLYDLAALRIVVALNALWVLLSRNLYDLAALPPEFFAGVPSGTFWRFLLFPGHPVVEMTLQGLAAVLLVLTALGLWVRWTALAAAALLYHLAPLEVLFWTGEPYMEGHTIPVIALVALAASPCAEVWSVRARHPPAPPAVFAGAPILLVQAQVSMIYFFSGYAKLWFAGLEWASARSMQGWLLALNQDNAQAAVMAVGPWLAQFPALCGAIGVVTLLFEFLFPLAIVSARARRILVPGALLFHIGIYLAMSITVVHWPLLLAFADWDAIRRGRRRTPASTPPG